MKKQNHKSKHPVHFKRKLIRLFVGVFVWLGLAVIYYIVFSFFFDTPVERGMKQSIVELEKEYEKLSERYDSIERIVDNLSERDRNIFRTLYDSEPLEQTGSDRQMEQLDSLMRCTNKELAAGFFDRFNRFEERMRLQKADFDLLQKRIETRGPLMNHIPAIQPVINPGMTLIASSYGMRIHPFYRSMVMHNGVDYAISEGSRVFATADGTVARIQNGQTHTGTTLVISHGGGYETAYHHLSRVLVREDARVRRGDIVALTGNTGLSLAPHLHYEVRFKGMPVDPVHYFFYELNPLQYEQVKRQAAVGMQALD